MKPFLFQTLGGKKVINLKMLGSRTRIHPIDGVIVAPGFGKRGIEGKISSIKYVRENKIPFFGICLGMQCACIEFSRNVLMKKEANSTEFNDSTNYPIIDLMAKQKKIVNKGGTMRLGSYRCNLSEKSITKKAYKKDVVEERHRHRYEFNSLFKDDFNKNGMMTTGINEKLKLVEVIELKNHPWFIGTQYHPCRGGRIRTLKSYSFLAKFLFKFFKWEVAL